MATPLEHLDALPLDDSDLEAIKECMVKVEAAPLKEHSESEVDLKELNGVMATFTTKFSLWGKVPDAEVKLGMKVRAIRVTEPSLLKVPDTVLLIPTAITSGNPSIENQALDLQSCLILTKDVKLKPSFHCLAFLLSKRPV